MNIKLNYNQLIRWFAYVLGVVLVIALISWLTVPRYLKSTLEQQVPEQIGRKLTIGDVNFNPFTLTVYLSGVVLLDAEKKDRDFSVERLVLKISPTSVFHLAPVVREVVATYPYLKLVRQQRNGIDENNFSDVIAKLAAHPSQGEPLRYYVANIQLEHGAIHLDDKVVGKEIHIEDINLGLPFVSNFAKTTDIFIEPRLSAKIDGTPFELAGRTKPFSDSYETSLTMDLNHLNLVPILAFAPKPLPFKVTAAKLSSQLSLNFVMNKNVANVTLSGAANFSDVAVSDFSDAPLVKAKALHISLTEANLTQEKFKLNSIVIDEPQVWVGLDGQGKLNWKTDNSEKKQVHENVDVHSVKPTTKSDLKPEFDLAHFKIKNGTVHWSDTANATPAMEIPFNHINIEAQYFSTRDKAPPGKLTIALGQEHHQRASFDGSIVPAHSSVTGKITFADFALANYQPYINRFLAANVSGNLSLKTQLAVVEGHVKLTEFSGAIDNLKLQAIQQAIQQDTTQDKTKRSKKEGKKGSGGSNDITATKIAIDNASLSADAKQINIDKVTLDRVQGDVFRDADGSFNLIRFIKSNSNSASANDVKSTQNQGQARSPDKESPSPRWGVDINQVVLSDSNFVFGDKSQNPAVNVRVDDMDAKLDNVSSKFAHPFTMALSANINAVGKSSGKIAVEGSVAEKSAQLKIDLQNFSVVALQPYFTDFLNITLEKGVVSTKGQLAWNAPADVNYKGVLKVENFSSSDKATSDSFLRWKNFSIDDIDAGLQDKKTKVILGKINISDFYARAILSEQGKLNLENILVQSGKADKEDKGAAVKNANTAPKNNSTNESGPIMTIGQVNLNNGVINYTDNFIKPHFSMRMTGMKGSVGTIQSTVAKPAPVNLSGKIDNDAPIVISGSLNPLFKPMLLDIKMTATGIDLPRLTSYSAKYAGYPIEKGKLSLDVEYHIKDKQLTANNTLKIDQLTFGKKVDSPDATKLPVMLLVDLLTDSNGRINLDVPISGTLDDPHFTVGGVIMKVLLNILTKVITSPFSLLAHSFSGGDQLSSVDFASGSAVLTDTTKTKLDSLAKALSEHPNLKLDIIGHADLTADGPGLREKKLARQIRKVNSQREEDEDAAIPDTDNERAITKIYAYGKFDKPRNMIGLQKIVSKEEMQSMILENTPISDDDLNALANRRAAAVRTYLTETAHVPAERIYANAPKINDAPASDKNEEKKAANGSRVDFDLKM